MSSDKLFDFGSSAVAQSYDEVLVPVMFRPWARDLLDRHQAWEGRKVVDLASGTGAVVEQLIDRVGMKGHIFAVDLNPAMLEVARARLADPHNVSFMAGSAEHIEVPDETIDVLVCQQGMQFFPDRGAAAAEVRRVLKPGGRVLASAWAAPRPGTMSAILIDSLHEIGETELEELMRKPFDKFGAAEFREMFAEGFKDVEVTLAAKELILPTGGTTVVDIAYASPIGPKLAELPREKREKFAEVVTRRADELSAGKARMGELESHVLTAIKAR